MPQPSNRHCKFMKFFWIMEQESMKKITYLSFLILQD